jgi:RNA polymerase sigma factor for flagellar operon FliA
MKAYAKAATGREERDRLIAEHVDAARRIALRVARRVPDWIGADDLIAAAMVGLTEAAERYDTSRGEPFLGFAEQRIRGAVLDELRRGDIMPRRLRTTARKIGTTIQELEQRLGRSPEDHEIAATLGVPVEEFQEDLKMLTHLSVIDVESERGSSESFSAPDASPAFIAERKELVRRVAEALPSLQQRDALILSLYYNEEFTYAEIGSLFGVSESRVCQLHSRALLRLRAELEPRRVRRKARSQSNA